MHRALKRSPDGPGPTPHAGYAEPDTGFELFTASGAASGFVAQPASLPQSPLASCTPISRLQFARGSPLTRSWGLLLQQRRHRPPALGQSRGARQLLQVPLQCSSCGKSLLQQAVRLCSRDMLRPARRACPSPAWAGRPYVLVRSGCSRWRLELQSLDWPVPQWRGRQSGTRPAGCFYRRPLQQAWLGPFCLGSPPLALSLSIICGLSYLPSQRPVTGRASSSSYQRTFA